MSERTDQEQPEQPEKWEWRMFRIGERDYIALVLVNCKPSFHHFMVRHLVCLTGGFNDDGLPGISGEEFVSRFSTEHRCFVSLNNMVFYALEPVPGLVDKVKRWLQISEERMKEEPAGGEKMVRQSADRECSCKGWERGPSRLGAECEGYGHPCCPECVNWKPRNP